ncbi:MAG: methionyl-tRNA formyltransferase [Bacteroidales bacterium]|nr:MAG: methionyl-tRNA formyltransferase [Bacteroidales bacterium]
MNNFRIVYMGTPDFAVAPLEALLNAGCNVVGVITNPDKPAGRGQQIKEAAVKKFAAAKGLKILQPEKFRNEEFIEELRALKADLQVVVAFKMLPEMVWDMPKYGTLNLHASLLPQYRGAAPINWAIINGDKETGVSTFLLQHKIDTGNILFQERISIGDNDNVEVIHDKLMMLGSELVVKTVQAIEAGEYPQIPQESLSGEVVELKSAPKIFKEDCKIDWSKDLHSIHNLIRGLSPYPASWTELVPNEEGKLIGLKIYASEKEVINHTEKIGNLLTDGKYFLKIAVTGGYISIKMLQQAGKKRMKIEDFLRGFQQIKNYHL